MRRVRDAVNPDRVFRGMGFGGRMVLAAAGFSAILLLPQPAWASDPIACDAPRALVAFDAPLRGLARIAERSREIRIVALGSSSTEGTGASTRQAAYPARFDREMDRRFPGKDFQVANLGKGGELAESMLVRLIRDVIPSQPALVLWQTGVNDAINGIDIEVFRKTLLSGIAALKAANIEVVLVDPQFYPRSAGVAHYQEYVAVMRSIAREQGVPVFRRYAIMQHLISSGQYAEAELLWKDKFHLNDVSYGCLADLMAKAVEAEIRRPQNTVISAGVAPTRPIAGWSPSAAY
jgi:lysophospholipase L1-like esterase